MHIRDIEKLKVWLLKKLEPLCDADPAALAKYIVALLRKDKPRSSLRELCVDQLEVFLAKETPPFVETLFSALDSEAYLSPGRQGNANNATTNSQQQPAQSGEGRGSPTGHHGYDRRPSEDTRHKEVDDDDRDFRRSRRGGVVTRDSSPHKVGVGGGRRGRIEPPRRTVRQRASQRQEDRVGRGQRGRSRSRSRSTTPDLETATGGGDSHKRELSAGANGPPNKKQRCKDYDEKGVCMLGEQCPYDHGVDPFVISPITGTFPPYAPPPFPLLPPQMPTLPPSKANTGLLLSTINSRHPPPTETDGGYNPEDPAITSTAPPSIMPPPPPPLLPPLQLGAGFPPSLPGIPSFHPPPPSLPPPPPSQHTRPFLSHNRGVVPMGGPPRMPSRPSDSIVLHKVPQQLNTITKLSGHFEKFGIIVNLQVRYDNDPESALIQFSSPSEAKAAHDCVEAVLNNRFIKVYYLKKGAQGQWTGKKMETTTNTPGAIAIANIRPDAMTSSQPHPPSLHSVNVNSKHEVTTSHSNSLFSTAAHDHTLKQQSPVTTVVGGAPHTHRTVVPSPTSTMPTAEKRLELQQKTHKLLQLQIQQQKLLLSKLEKSGKNLSAEEKTKVLETLKSLSSSIGKLRDTLASATKTALMKDPVRRHPHRDHTPQSPDTTTDSSLQVKATQLRNEARKLGILPDSVTPSQGTGGEEWVGRKKPDLRSKLDSRPRQILVVGACDKDALTSYFESFGGLNQVEVDPDNPKNLIFTFRTRGIAEKAVRNGSVFQGTPLIMKWYSPKQPPSINSSSGPLSTISLGENGHPVVTRPKLMLNLEAMKQEEQPLPHRRTSISPSLDSLLLSPNTTATNPRVVHLVEDDEEEEERSWRR